MNQITDDPRLVGHIYHNGYCRQAYTVLAMWSCLPGPAYQPWLKVQWADGRITTHCTAWDPRKDAEILEGRAE